MKPARYYYLLLAAGISGEGVWAVLRSVVALPQTARSEPEETENRALEK